LEFRQLKYFVRIVEVGSVSRASQSLHVAQPALSAQISRLEEELGVKLLDRSVRGVTPTEVGAAVFQQAQLILKQVEATQLVASQADSGPAGPVAIGLPWTVASVLGLALLKEVSATLKSVRLEITEGPSSVLAQLLAQGKLDVAVTFDNTTDGGLRMQPVVSEPLLLVGARGSLADRSESTLAEAAVLPLLLLSRPNGIREEIERIWSVQGIKPRLVAEINAPGLLIDAVRDGLGYSVLPSCAIEDRLKAGELDAVALEAGALTRTVYLSTSRLFATTRAAEHVHALVTHLMHDAVREGRWQGKWLGE
jgi:LysR family nitrogen assimilation transcriptional regulator